MKSQKELRETKREQEELVSRLKAMEERLQDVMEKTAELVSEKKELQGELSNKEEQRDEVIALKEKAERQEVLLSILAEIERSVREIKERIAHLESSEIEERSYEDSELRLALEVKQRELDECRRNLKAREEELFKANVKIHTERQLFDFKMQVVTSSGKEREELQKVSTVK